MDRLRLLLRKTGEVEEQEYRPLYDEGGVSSPENDDEHGVPLSWAEYGIFVVLGVAMLWAWYVCARALAGCIIESWSV